MRKFLITLALMVFTGSALAGWNIRQNADGSAVWVDGDGNTAPVGSPGLVAELDDLATASTAYVVTRRAGKIKLIYGVSHDGGGLSNVQVLLQSTAASDQFAPVTTGTLMTFATSSTPNVQSVVPEDIGSTNFTVSAGQLIAISTDGTSTDTARGTFTIVIE
jgi:hypothetical protein